MTVTQAIAALLYDHGTVIVPGLGAFVRHDESAQVNVVTNAFQRPSSSLSFDPAQREESPLLIDYLAQNDSIGTEEARQQIAAFVADCYTTMREGATVTLEGLGTLCYDSLQEPVFEPDPAADFNVEAFGLQDLEAQPVYRAEQPQLNEVPFEEKGSGTPIPVEEKIDPIKDHHKKTTGEGHSRPWWPWFLLVLLLGAAAIWLLNPRPKPVPPVTPVTTDSTEVIPEPVELPTDTLTPSAGEVGPESDTLTTPPEIVEEPEPPQQGPTPPTQVVRPAPESRAFIVGGCFSVEQNALNMAMEAFEQGCTTAFVMKRGEKFFVCYGQYPTAAEAKAALPDILSNYNDKAWILTK